MGWTRLRQDIAAIKLREEAKKEKNSGMCRRLLGIAHLLETGNRQEAQQIACLTVNTFRTWMKRFNEEGIAGLRAKKSPGRPLALSKEKKEALRKKVLEGPSPEEGLVRYRLCDLQDFLKEEHQISLCTSGVWNHLQELKLTWKTGRQRHPKSDEEAQEAFKKTSKKSC
jgi:transposase